MARDPVLRWLAATVRVLQKRLQELEVEIVKKEEKKKTDLNHPFIFNPAAEEFFPSMGDALDKARYESFTVPDMIEALPDFYTETGPDKTNSAITFEDFGMVEPCMDDALDEVRYESSTDPDEAEALPYIYTEIGPYITFEDSGMVEPCTDDALDEARYESSTDPDKTEAQPNFYNDISPDKTNSAITFEDSGMDEPCMDDALDEVRYESIIDPDKIEALPDSHTEINTDKTNSAITIEDSGIGMTMSDSGSGRSDEPTHKLGPKERCFIGLLNTSICYCEWRVSRNQVGAMLSGLGFDVQRDKLNEALDELEEQGLPNTDLAELAMSAGLLTFDDVRVVRRMHRLAKESR